MKIFVRLLLLVISLIIAYCVFFPKDAEAKRKDVAILCAEDAVRQRLKAPSTAKFVESKVLFVEGEYYGVYVAVDAQNSFGATIRDGFLVSIKPDFKESGSGWIKVTYVGNPTIMNSSTPATQEELLVFLAALSREAINKADP